MTDKDLISASYDQYIALLDTITGMHAQRLVSNFELERVAMDKENYLSYLSGDLTYGLAKEMGKFIEMTSKPGESDFFGGSTLFEKTAYVIKDYDAFTDALKALIASVAKASTELTVDEMMKRAESGRLN